MKFEIWYVKGSHLILIQLLSSTGRVSTMGFKMWYLKIEILYLVFDFWHLKFDIWNLTFEIWYAKGSHLILSQLLRSNGRVVSLMRFEIWHFEWSIWNLTLSTWFWISWYMIFETWHLRISSVSVSESVIESVNFHFTELLLQLK